MCYYNGQKVTRAEYIRLKELEKELANYDFLNTDLEIGFEYKTTAVLKPIPGKNDFEIVQMEWGLIPHYIHSREDLEKLRKGGVDPDTGKFKPPILTLNAIGEELLDKVSYKQAAKQRRCIVLSSGFYEWRHIIPISKKTGKPLKTAVKIPHYISIKDKEYFFMAGIWSPFTDKKTGEYVESVSIVTTKANSLMEKVHNVKKRMPTILPEDLAYCWMFDELSDDEITKLATYQFPAEEMYAHTVQKEFIGSLNPTEKFVYEEYPELVY